MLFSNQLLLLSVLLLFSVHSSDVRSLPQSKSTAIPMNINSSEQNNEATAASVIRTIQIQSTEHALQDKSTTITKGMIQSRKLIQLIQNDLAGGGTWSQEPSEYIDVTQQLITKGETTYKKAVQIAHLASICAESCHNDECLQCTTSNNDPMTLDQLKDASRNNFIASYQSFLKSKTAVEASKQKLLSATVTMGEIIEMAKNSAASSCSELEKWLDILIDITSSHEKIHAKEMTTNQKSKNKQSKQNINKKINQEMEKRKITLMKSLSLRGSSEETRKTLVASKAHIQLQQEDTRRKSPSQCEHLYHCKDILWLKTEMKRDGCIHGCSKKIQLNTKETCDNKCQSIYTETFVGPTIDMGALNHQEQNDFLQGCTNSCDGLLKDSKKPPTLANWRSDRLGDTVVVPHGGTETGSAGDVAIERLDDVPLKAGHGFRCNETTAWKPCFDTCNGIHGKIKSIERSGCIYGCRIVLVRSLPDSHSCNQYCDEVTDQVLTQVHLYGNESLIDVHGSTRKQKQRAWASTCADSCTNTFEMRLMAGFDQNKIKGGAPCF